MGTVISSGDFSVDGRIMWQTIFTVAAGQIITIDPSTSNQWSFNVPARFWCGPDGWDGQLDPPSLQQELIVPTARVGTLLLKVNSEAPLVIGGQLTTFTALESGYVYMSMNDIPSAFYDNGGNAVGTYAIVPGVN